MTTREFPRKKGQIAFSVVLSIAVIISVSWFIRNKMKEGVDFGTTWLFFAGFLDFVFVVFLIQSLRRLFAKGPGIIISDEGIMDNTGFLAGRLLRWENAVKCDNVRNGIIEMVAVKVLRPEELTMGLGSTARRAMEKNIVKYGTPFVLSPSLAEFSVIEMYKLVEEKIAQKGAGSGAQQAAGPVPAE
ncbi:MAG TPA: STM3941 family protein [Bacteroidia bacterium]|nr:STM3941 family protein [Bacteroidia bacterium]